MNALSERQMNQLRAGIFAMTWTVFFLFTCMAVAVAFNFFHQDVLDFVRSNVPAELQGKLLPFGVMILTLFFCLGFGRMVSNGFLWFATWILKNKHGIDIA